MKKILLLIGVITLMGIASPVSAHELETDGQIGAVLHIDPADSPRAGQQANLFFDLKDKQGKFSLEQCDCKVVVQQNGEELYSVSPTSVSGVLTTAYTFPSKGVYQLQLQGKPLQKDSFAAFTLTYDISIEQEISLTTSGYFSSHWASVLLIVAGAIGFGLYLLLNKSTTE